MKDPSAFAERSTVTQGNRPHRVRVKRAGLRQGPSPLCLGRIALSLDNLLGSHRVRVTPHRKAEGLLSEPRSDSFRSENTRASLGQWKEQGSFCLLNSPPPIYGCVFCGLSNCKTIPTLEVFDSSRVNHKIHRRR